MTGRHGGSIYREQDVNIRLTPRPSNTGHSRTGNLFKGSRNLLSSLVATFFWQILLELQKKLVYLSGQPPPVSLSGPATIKRITFFAASLRQLRQGLDSSLR